MQCRNSECDEEMRKLVLLRSEELNKSSSSVRIAIRGWLFIPISLKPKFGCLKPIFAAQNEIPSFFSKCIHKLQPTHTYNVRSIPFIDVRILNLIYDGGAWTHGLGI